MLKNKKVSIGILIFGVLLSLPLLSDFIPLSDQLVGSVSRISALADRFSLIFAPEGTKNFGYNASTIQGTVFYLFPALLVKLHLPAFHAFKIMVVLINFATLVISFICFKKCFKEDDKAFLAMTLYAMTPFRACVIYSDGDLNQAIALTFLPVVIMGMWQIYTKESKKAWAMLTVGLGLTLASSVTLYLMALGGVIITAVILWKDTFCTKNIIELLKSMFASLVCGLWILIPVLLQVIKTPDELGVLVAKDYKGKGLYLIQYLRIFFQKGNSSDFFANGMLDSKAYGVGIAITLGFVAFVWLLFSKDLSKIYEDGRKNKYVRIFISAIVFVILSSHIFPWDIFQNKNRLFSCKLAILEAPYMWMSIVICLMIPVCICCYDYFKDERNKKIAFSITVLLSVLVNQYYINDLFFDCTPILVTTNLVAEGFNTMPVSGVTLVGTLISVLAWALIIVYMIMHKENLQTNEEQNA